MYLQKGLRTEINSPQREANFIQVASNVIVAVLNQIQPSSKEPRPNKTQEQLARKLAGSWARDKNSRPR